MWYTIILLSIALAVSVAFWIRADRMAGHYRRKSEREKRFAEWAEKVAEKECAALRKQIGRLIDDECAAQNAAHDAVVELTTTRRQLAAARGQITKLRRKYGEIE